MSLAEADVQARLRALVDPNTGRDFVAGKSVKRVAVDGNDVAVDIQLGYPARSQHDAIRRLVADALASLPGVGRVHVTVGQKITSHAVQRGVKLVPGVKKIDVGFASALGDILEHKRALLRLHLPGELLFLVRIRFGAYSVLSRMDAQLDWRELEGRAARAALA